MHLTASSQLADVRRWGDTKTYRERVVDLVEPALDALHAMKPFSMAQRNSRETQDDIIQNPQTGRPRHDERSQRDVY